MVPFHTKKRYMRAKLIFNPSSGIDSASPVQLMDVIKEMQAWKLIPEVCLVGSSSCCDLKEVVQDAIAQGIQMFVVCGGDGTISSVASTLVGTNATLGIIPTGTQNNVALSLGIPKDIPAAIAILRKGRRIKIDVGMVVCNENKTAFIEICSVGLFSSLFPSSDEIQHGNLARVGDFLATLISSPPAEIHLLLDNKKEINKQGHVVLVSNMPYTGSNFQLGSEDSYKDGLLDVLFFADLSKIDLLGYVFKGGGIASEEDPRIQHFRVLRVDIETKPAMPVMADGVALGEGPVSIEVLRSALAVMVGSQEPKVLYELKMSKKLGEIVEK